MRYPGEYATELASAYGCGRTFPEAVECYAVDTLTGEVSRVLVTMVRGSSDWYDRRADYAHTTDGRVLPAGYLFPVKGKRPTLEKVADAYGTCEQWVQTARKKARA